MCALIFLLLCIDMNEKIFKLITNNILILLPDNVKDCYYKASKHIFIFYWEIFDCLFFVSIFYFNFEQFYENVRKNNILKFETGIESLR